MMQVQWRIEQLKHAFLDRLLDLPVELSVPKFRRWSGTALDPIPQVQYAIKYAGDTLAVLRRVAQYDQTCFPLRRRFEFSLDESRKELRVSLIPAM